MQSAISGTKQKKNILAILLILAGLVMAFHRPLFSLISPAQLSIQIHHQPAIMPAVYKVYANDNALDGKYSLFKMLVTNNSSNAAQNVEVSYQIPNYIEWKTITKIPVILPGASVVVNCYPSFADKIVEKTTSSKEVVNIKVKGTNISDIENEFSIDIKGRNEFLYSCIPTDEIRTSSDYFDNILLLSCYVTPEDPIVKYYTQKVQEKILKGETASVEKKEPEGVRFMTGIYYATLVSHMVYSGTTGVPAKIDDVTSILQNIRLPREVLSGKTGLCIELSLLYASIMASAGMDPVIYLIPGHAYPGFKMNGHYYAIESTGIGGEGMGGRMTTEQAYKTGMKNLDEFFKRAMAGDDRYQLLDVREAIKKGAVAMELKDDPYLRQKIDEIGKSFESNSDGASSVQNSRTTAIPSEKENTGGRTSNGYNLFEGVVTFAYPGSWKFRGIPAGLMAAFKHNIISRDAAAAIEVYDFSGYGFNSPVQGIAAIRQFIVQAGAGDMQYRNAGTNSAGYSLFTGQAVYVNGASSNWVAAFKLKNNGVVGMLVGTLSTANPEYRSMVNNIINSIR